MPIVLLPCVRKIIHSVSDFVGPQAGEHPRGRQNLFAHHGNFFFGTSGLALRSGFFPLVQFPAGALATAAATAMEAATARMSSAARLLTSL
jgi:hypothetical protein